METENFTTLEELFAELIDDPNFASSGLNSQQILQLQGQIEESLGLLNDVVEELRDIAPDTVSTIRTLTLQIFEEDSESSELSHCDQEV